MKNFPNGILAHYYKAFCTILPAIAISLSAGSQEISKFADPPREYYPETWFHFISGNVSKEGITADLEAIAGAGFSGVHLFHGHFTDAVWPGVEEPVKCLGPLWDDAVKHAATESARLGLKFTMQNCPGWAMSGGPWIEPENAMRHVVMSRSIVDATGGIVELMLSQPGDNEDWRDYKDIAVLAFPTPAGDEEEMPEAEIIATNRSDVPWLSWLHGEPGKGITLAPTLQSAPHKVVVKYDKPVTVRSLEITSIESMGHYWCYQPDTRIRVTAGNDQADSELIDVALPQSAWQDGQLMTLALPETTASVFGIEISNGHDIYFDRLKLSTAARKNNWETEAGWDLRSIERTAALPVQSKEAFIDGSRIIDLSDRMDANGKLTWKAPEGKWTIIRFGHQNNGQKNAPAPVEGTGWECDKLSAKASTIHFDNYIGRLSASDGALSGGLLKGMLLDSWECRTQTWTPAMEQEFDRLSGYELRKWLPAIFGYVIDDHETTTRFLRDWRRTINSLIVGNYFGNMSRLAKQHGLTLAYETAIGDVVPGDILQFYKHADMPMCEFWQPVTHNFVGSDNFKPIKPTVSAARMYGKPRIGAEAFTSFSHTWDESLAMLKEVANIHMATGVSHLVFHTYTHNPQVDFLPPGTSFGGQGIGTPFLRGQTWWRHMPAFTGYLARCGYMLEEGVPVADVLWYLSDEMDHKPDQSKSFLDGYDFDYCNSDALINRLTVDPEGNIVTPEGISYRLLWIPDSKRMLPETLDALHRIINAGATVVCDAPDSPATLSGGAKMQRNFERKVNNLWDSAHPRAHRTIGKGMLLSGITLDEAIAMLGLKQDVITSSPGSVLWSHRRSDHADWYFITSPFGQDVAETLSFNCTGVPQLWNPIDGSVTIPDYRHEGERTLVTLDMPQGGSSFVVFDPLTDSSSTKKAPRETTTKMELISGWDLSFPSGWGAPENLSIEKLTPWCDIAELSAEGKAFSGTVTYTTEFEIPDMVGNSDYMLDLGEVAHIAQVELNGEALGTVWCKPYRINLGKALRNGKNRLTIKVTGTWFNRLVYDSSLAPEQRKTWAINVPAADQELRPSGLLGPVTLSRIK